MGVIHVETAVAIDRPAAEVFAFIADVANNPRFQGGMRSCVWTSPPPTRLGSTYDQVAAFLGRQIVSRFVIDEYEPGRRIRFRSTAGPLSILERRTVTATGDGGCTVEVVLDGDPGTYFRWAGPFLNPLGFRQRQGQLPAAEGPSGGGRGGPVALISRGGWRNLAAARSRLSCAGVQPCAPPSI